MTSTLNIKQGITWHNLLFVLIITFAFFLRLNKIDSSPPSLFSDEVDAQYQTLFFRQCSSDYFGRKTPVSFKSFADYRTSAFIYFSVIISYFIGFSDFLVRYNSLLFGILSLIGIYLWAFQLFKSKSIALTSTFLLSISPWFFHYNRTGFEVSGMICFYVFASYFFNKFRNTNQFRFLAISSILFIITPYFYSTAKLFLIFTSIVYFIFNFKILTYDIKKTIISLLPALIFSLPLIMDTLSGNSSYRFNYISIFTDPTYSSQVDYQRRIVSQTQHPFATGLTPSYIDQVFINKPTSIFNKFSANYLSAFSTNFLLTTGDSNFRHSLPNHGVIYLFDLILVLASILFYSKKPIKEILILLILSPIPFALTRDSTSPHATRLITMLPFIIILASYSFAKLNYLIRFPIVIIYLVSFFGFYYHYLNTYPQVSALDWHQNIKETILQQQSLDTKYSDFYFSSNPESFLPFFLYYTHYLPKDCDISSHYVHENTDQFSGISLDSKYHFGNIEWPQVKKENSVYIVSEYELPTLKNNQPQLKVLSTLNSPYQNSIKYYLLAND